jgi:hypothetical protein
MGGISMGRLGQITTMINTAQIFVIYEPGLFGTFLTKLFTYHNFFTKEDKQAEFESDENGFNAHVGGYSNRLKNFHMHEDFERLSKEREIQLLNFFQPLTDYNLSVHRLASYFFTKIHYEKFFSKFVRIIILPKEHRLPIYAERMYHSTYKTLETEYWYKNIKKNIENVPDFFKQQMSIKEKLKYLTEHRNMLLKDYTIDKKCDLIFDPDDIVDIDKLQKLINDTCKILNVETFAIPNCKIQKFLHNNKFFF